MTDQPFEPPLDVETTVTPGHRPLLDRRQVKALSDAARKAGTVLLVAGAAGVVAWAWLIWRTVDSLRNTEEADSTGFVFGFVDGEATATDYADAFAQSAYFLMLAAAVVGIGVIVRILAAHVAALGAGGRFDG